jgi:RNA polymerase sigma factor (TIGR02999 family)
MAYASRVMRGLIIDYVRNRQAQKRGGHFEITSIGTDVAEGIPDHRELERISDALDELTATDPMLAQMVDFKFFCGFSLREIAAMRGVSERTIRRDWEKARIFLHRAIRSNAPLSSPYPRGFAPRTPLHAFSRAAAPARFRLR